MSAYSSQVPPALGFCPHKSLSRSPSLASVLRIRNLAPLSPEGQGKIEKASYFQPTGLRARGGPKAVPTSGFALHEPSTQCPQQGQSLTRALQQILSVIILSLLWFQMSNDGFVLLFQIPLLQMNLLILHLSATIR